MKEIARTIIDMTTSKAMQRLLDRHEPIDSEHLEELAQHWEYDLYSRKPGPAYFENGVFKPTDLDLACFLSALVQRGAVLNLPTYKSQRPKTMKEGEWITSSGNRHGKAVKLVSNKDVFSFSLQIVDQNVVQTSSTSPDQVGAPRNFMLVGLDGSWSEGWRKIEFVPSAKENDFLNDKKLWTGNTVVFSNFVHPNRWTSFYGKYYFLTKLVINRLEEENKHLRQEIKRLLSQGVVYPATGDGAKKEWPKQTTGEGVSRKFKALQVEVDAPWKGTFPLIDSSQASLIEATERVRWVAQRVLPGLKFATRATELAFFQAGCSEKGFPAWIKGAEWTHDYVVKGKRSKWERLVLNQTFPGELGFALRYRVYEKSEKVAA